MISAITNILQAILSFGNIIGIGLIVDALISKQNSSQIFTLILIFISVNLVISVIKELLMLAMNYMGRKATNTAQYMYAQDSVDVNYHYAQDGTILDLKKKSMVALPAFYIDHLGDIIRYIVQFFSVITIVSYFSPLFLLILSLTSAVSVYFIFQTKKDDLAFQNEKVKDDRKLDYLYLVMTEYGYAKEVRINRAEDYAMNKYDGIMREQFKRLKTLLGRRMKINIGSTVIAVVQTALMYLYFSYMAFSDRISISEYTVLLGSTALFVSLILGFFEKIALFGRTLNVLDYYFEYRDTTTAGSDIHASNAMPYKKLDFSHPVIRFENVSFTYPKTEKTVLENINLELRPSERIGLVGLNGSGKTTLVKLLTRLYDPTEGRITLNGIDIREIPYEQYASKIGIVLQDYYLFAYSVKENIVLAAPYDEEKLSSCLEKSGSDEKIDKLPNGINTPITKTLDNDGIEFSGGEGQKLALARAIYKDTPILILDEPSSALDPIAEYELFSQLDELSENKLALFISHRLSSTKFCDRIVVLSDGKIVETGCHDDLMHKKGEYYDLFNSQAKYYKEG
ncbi:MAG TPA: ABC transporter ATP-binding protein [Clostridiales bacterium]|nr:ABC transporter ATP-binding protein [Clostridiales bacterium]